MSDRAGPVEETHCADCGGPLDDGLLWGGLCSSCMTTAMAELEDDAPSTGAPAGVSHMATIFSEGDRALFDGDVLTSWTTPLCPGDIVTVTSGNEDADDDVLVTFRGSHYYVSAHDLTWLPSE